MNAMKMAMMAAAMLAAGACAAAPNSKSVPSVKAAHDVIVRFAGKEAAKNVVLRKDLPKRDGGCDRFVYEVKG
ncbi:MAG: hypothetical protein K6F50_03035, partial [Kiritimatiellae bacterium]|nr:hypothetical protein [Kiritimatiellia bacterium]